MRIALVAPPFGPTGGPEVVVQNLALELTAKDIDFTLFAPKDWETPFPHIATLPKSLWQMENFSTQDDFENRNFLFGSQTVVLRHQSDFDLIHLHSHRTAYAVAMGSSIPVVVTTHSKLSQGLVDQMLSADVHIVGLTQSQVRGTSIDTLIGNGIPLADIAPSFEPGEYLLAVGRLNLQKGIHQAIEIAKKAKKKLVIIGRVGISEERKDYFEKSIKPHIDGQNIVHIESVPREHIFDYFRKASFLIFPITSPESNPLVVMEALASGTPILATEVDPLPEMLPNSAEVAFLSNDLDKLAKAAQQPERFSRVTCREYAEKNFNSSRMAEDYISLYKEVLSKPFSSHKK